MLATFMPMKAILFLASNAVPGFFPTALVKGGPVVAALAMIVAATAFAGVAWLGNRLVTDLDEGTKKGRSQQLSLLHWNTEGALKATKEREFTTSVALVFPISLLLVVASYSYFLFTLTWIGMSAVWALLRVRRSSRVALYESGADQFSHQLAEWLRLTVLPSVVTLALITLLLAPPALGSTAILIAAIFGRRLILAVADITPQLTTKLITQASQRAPERATRLVNHQPRGTAVKKPIEFLSSPVGRQQLDRELRRLGLDPEDFKILAPSQPFLSISSFNQSGHQFLIRIFSLDSSRERDEELKLRQSLYGNLFSPSDSVRIDQFAGFPAILVELASPRLHVGSTAAVQHENIFQFQLERELESVDALSLGPVSPKFGSKELTDQLHRMSNIPGIHREKCCNLVQRIPEIYQHLAGLPTALVPSSPLSADHFYVSADGSTRYLGGVAWVPGHMGDTWGNIAHFEDPNALTLYDSYACVAGSRTAVLLNAQMCQLHDVMRKFQISRLEPLLSRIQTSLDILSKQ